MYPRPFLSPSNILIREKGHDRQTAALPLLNAIQVQNANEVFIPELSRMKSPRLRDLHPRVGWVTQPVVEFLYSNMQ